MIRWSPARPLRPRCPHGRLSRLLGKFLPPDLHIAASSLRPWASANFVGARHHFALNWMDTDPQAISPDHNPKRNRQNAMVARLESQLALIEWPLYQHIVADISAQPATDHDAILLEILTVEE